MNLKKEKIDTYDIHNKKYSVYKSSLDLSVHVYGIAVKDNKILIVPQFDGYDFPGGTAEKGETHIDTLIREFKEETGLRIEPLEILNVYTSFFHALKDNRNFQSYLIYYLVKVIDGNISDNGFDEYEKEYAKTAKWVDISSLRKMKHINTIDIADDLLNIVQSKIKEGKY